MIGSPQAIAAWCWEQKPDAVIEAKVKSGKRSLTANAYYWVLLNQLAAHVGVSDTEAHEHMLKDYGVRNLFTVRSDVPLGDYFDHYQDLGQAWLNGKEYRHVMVYKGSSKMDSKEFARLVDGVIHECEQVGIPTLSREEAARLEWVAPC